MAAPGDNLKRLLGLLRARHPLIFIPTIEEPYALGLLREAALELNSDHFVWSAVSGVRNGLLEPPDAVAGTENAAAALVHWAARKDHGILVMQDLVAHLSDPHVLRALRDAVDGCERDGSTIVLVDHAHELPGVVASRAERFEPALPDEAELEQIIVREIRKADRESRVRLGTGKSGIQAVARAMRGLTRAQAARLVTECIIDDRTFDRADLQKVLAAKRRMLSAGGALEAVEAPASLDEVGGLERLKAWLRQREAALDGEKAETLGLSAPRGVLILGVQGAGKSLCAKAIATAWHRPLLRLDPGALYDRYVGESERRLREALRTAEAMAPVILWIDEIEKGFASAASRSTDGGLSQRMFGTLLTWMQEHRAPVFITATANDIEALPPELLRKGRFDEIFFVDLPSAAVRKRIFEIHLKTRGRDPKAFDLEALVEASEGFSGAEIEQAIVAGLYTALESGSDLRDSHLLSVVRTSPPLSATMAERIEALRHWAKGRCVPADQA